MAGIEHAALVARELRRNRGWILTWGIVLVLAGLAGIGIPVLLERFGIDPALASGAFVTTVTDVVGFFAFLGLAAWVLI